VTSIGGGISINDNESLTSLSGLDNIEANSIEDLTIHGNPNLSHCSVLSICNYLSNPNGTILIASNTTGCDSPAEVQDSCVANSVFIDEQLLKTSLTIYPNPASQELNTTAEGYTIDEVTIYTLTGQRILQDRPVDGTIDISHLQQGMYIVEVTIENTRIRKKFLVQR